MKNSDLIKELQAIPIDAEVEFTYKIRGRYPDDSDNYYRKITNVTFNESRKTIVLE